MSRGSILLFVLGQYNFFGGEGVGANFGVKISGDKFRCKKFWETNFGGQILVAKFRWPNLGGQISVDIFQWAIFDGQISVGKLRWPNFGGQI